MSTTTKGEVPASTTSAEAGAATKLEGEAGAAPKTSVADAGLAKLNPDATEYRPAMRLKWNNDTILNSLICSQIEYFFSDFHLQNDTYLAARIAENKDRWVSIKLLCESPRIRSLTTNRERVISALKDSRFLELNSDKSMIRRPNVKVPKLKPQKDLRRTVFIFGVPKSKRDERTIRSLCEDYGSIKTIWFESDATRIGEEMDSDDDGPSYELAQLITRRKFTIYSDADEADSKELEATLKLGEDRKDGDARALIRSLFRHPVQHPSGDPQNFGHLYSCFVVFSSQSQATKCVKARAKSVDGIRAMHKYDYCKIEKRYRAAELKGEVLSLSPTRTPLIGGVAGGFADMPYAHLSGTIASPYYRGRSGPLIRPGDDAEPISRSERRNNDLGAPMPMMMSRSTTEQLSSVTRSKTAKESTKKPRSVSGKSSDGTRSMSRSRMGSADAVDFALKDPAVAAASLGDDIEVDHELPLGLDDEAIIGAAISAPRAMARSRSHAVRGVREFDRHEDERHRFAGHPHGHGHVHVHGHPHQHPHQHHHGGRHVGGERVMVGHPPHQRPDAFVRGPPPGHGGGGAVREHGHAPRGGRFVGHRGGGGVGGGGYRVSPEVQERFQRALMEDFAYFQEWRHSKEYVAHGPHGGGGGGGTAMMDAGPPDWPAHFDYPNPEFDERAAAAAYAADGSAGAHRLASDAVRVDLAAMSPGLMDTPTRATRITSREPTIETTLAADAPAYVPAALRSGSPVIIASVADILSPPLDGDVVV
jgi:hypothetical protein